jgi:Na+-driven multidrug efflux pump
MNAILMGLMNVFFDYVLIFGHWGFPALGIGGAALASVIAEASSVLFFILYTTIAVDLKKYGFIGKIIRNLKIIKNILKVSLSLMVQYFLSLSTWFIFFLAIEQMGEMPLAVSNIVRSLYMILWVPFLALSSTTNTLVSNTIGAGKPNEVIPLIWKIVRLTVSIAMGVVLILGLFPTFALRIYTSDAALIRASIPSLYVILLVLLVLSAGNVFFQAVSGTGNTKSALLIEITTLIAYCFWIWFIVIHLQASLAVCWISELIYAALIGILSFIYLKRGRWVNKKI